MIYRLAQGISYSFLKLFFGLKVQGLKEIPAKGPFILASNHISNLDPVVVGCTCYRKVTFLAKEELFKGSLISWLLGRLSCIPLKRDKADIAVLRTSLKLLKISPVLIFPQGTRSENYDSFKSGVGFLYKKSLVPLVIAKIYGTDKVLPRGAKFFKRGRIEIKFKRLEGLTGQDSYEEIASKIITQIKSL